MKIFLTAIALIFSVATTANAAIYQQGIIYVIYDEAGERSVTDKTDKNSNGVPDVIEDIATQVNAAREVFNGVFNFTDPLACARFKNVTSIEIDIESKENLKVVGKAFGDVRKKSKHDPNERALYLKIANTINPHVISTPTHEYFHLVQFATTYFRNDWYLEGMARWSQDAIDKINYPDGADIHFKLKSKSAAEKIFNGKYDVADFLWYPLAVNKKDKIKLPRELIDKYKYVDGSPVFKDDIFFGPNVMLKVLHVMKTKEELAAQNFLNVKEWHKKGQRSEKNNEIILNCVKEVYHDKFLLPSEIQSDWFI